MGQKNAMSVRDEIRFLIFSWDDFHFPFHTFSLNVY